MMPAIRTSRLCKDFGDFTAVKSLDLEVRRGEIYGLLGPNGAGKTTTVRMVVGVLKPTSGTAEVLGKPSGDRAVRRLYGYMPQALALHQGITVMDNLRFHADLYSVSREDMAVRFPRLLELVDLQDWRNSLVSDLSGGMKHRLSLICTMVHNPELLILDEPTVGVDPLLRESFWKHFRGITDEGKTIVITTHYMDEARRCDRVGFMRGGELIAEGTPGEIMERTGTDNLEDAFLTITGVGR